MKKQSLIGLIILSALGTTSLFARPIVKKTQRSTTKINNRVKKSSLLLNATNFLNTPSPQIYSYTINVGDSITLKSTQYKRTGQVWSFAQPPLSLPSFSQNKNKPKQAFKNLLNKAHSWTNKYDLTFATQTFKALQKGTFEFYAVSTQFPVITISEDENGFNSPQVAKITLHVK
jgi:hypothetical protein